MLRFTLIRVTLAAMAFALAACGSADNGSTDTDARVRLNANKSSARFGDYTIHVNAMLTSELTPEIAQSYGIARSENQGLVNMVVLSKDGGDAETPIAGKVEVSASNLNGQLKNMELLEIADGASIYYIGAVAIANREIINFDFDVQPAGSNQVLLIRFTYEFYTK